MLKKVSVNLFEPVKITVLSFILLLTLERDSALKCHHAEFFATWTDFCPLGLDRGFRAKNNNELR